METFKFQLSDAEFRRLDREFPKSYGSGRIGQRAEEIVKTYFRSKDAECTFCDPVPGADLQVQPSDGARPIDIEVKGTASAEISWGKLKVSSDQSHDLLSQHLAPIYRVTSVFSRTPTIFVLIFGEDFHLTREPRWAIKGIVDKKREAASHPSGSSDRRGQIRAEIDKPSKYEGLKVFLLKQEREIVTLRFKDAMDVIGVDLPKSAYSYQAFWAN